MTAVKCTSVINAFSCLGDKCEDTCCKAWSMQVDDATRELYETSAPELLDAIEPAVETPWIMRKDAKTGFCVKFEGGLCGIHKSYGDRFLGNACHFYPRITRTLGSKVLMTGSMSCPEIARIALFEALDSAFVDQDIERLPFGIKNYLPEGMNEDDALSVHKAFLDAAEDQTATAETIFLRMASATRSLERQDIMSWPVMAAFYLQHADSRIPKAETNIADPFNLLHSLCGLIVATHKPMSERLKLTIDTMEQALAVKLDWANMQIDVDDKSLEAYQKMKQEWAVQHEAQMAPMLRRWLQMQMSVALFPFSGLGNTLSERITIIGVRLAIIKLAILCNCSMHKEESLQAVVIRVVQSLSRLLDHLGDATFSLSIFSETGWTSEARMRGLLEQ